MISDKFDPAQAVELLRLGVADYLSRPLDLSRMAMLADFFILAFAFTKMTSDRLRWALTHPVQRTRIAGALRAVVACYDWATVAPQYDALMAKVANR